MPSLWKKNRGKKFSKLVSDLQTPPSKYGGSNSLVETGFPTSIVDLFVKNRDKLKRRQKTKKIKSTKPTISEDDNDSDNKSYVNYNPRSFSCCELDKLNGPTCSFARNNHQKKVDNFEENSVTSDSSLENIDVSQSPVVESSKDCCKFERINDENKKKFVVIFNSRKYVMLLSILMGALCFGVVLFAKNWFLALVTLGVLLLLLFKKCGNCAWMKVMKCVLVVLVVLNTKCYVAGITIGVCFLIILECVGNSIFGFFKVCQNANGKLQCIWPHWGDCNEQTRENSNGEQVGNVAISSSNCVPKFQNGFVSQRGVEEGKKCSRGNSPCNKNSLLVVGVKQRKSMSEVSLESDDSKEPKSSDCSDSTSNSRKEKKKRKFWKKLISRKRSSKRKKQEYDGKMGNLNSDCMQEIASSVGEDDQGVSEGRLSTSTGTRSRSRSRSTTSLTEGEESGTDNSEAGKFCVTEMLQLDNQNTNSCGNVKERYQNIKYFIAIVIPLIGLIGGRVLAIVFTVICWLVFKIVKKLRKNSVAN